MRMGAVMKGVPKSEDGQIQTDNADHSIVDGETLGALPGRKRRRMVTNGLFISLNAPNSIL
jgi:hypothetical protein